jgi:hypothetical protein
LSRGIAFRNISFPLVVDLVNLPCVVDRQSNAIS